MSLKAMADNVRAERQRAQAAAPAAQHERRLAAARAWKEQKRRAWSKARPIFEAAFRRQFTPERFFYEAGTQNRCQYIKVAINYEGKLWAFVKVFSDGVTYLYLHPIDADPDTAKLLRVGNDPLDREALYGKVAALVEEWRLG